MAEDQTNSIDPADLESGMPPSGDALMDSLRAAPAEHTPTPEEARDMFAQNPGLWAVLTTEGNKLRGEC